MSHARLQLHRRGFTLVEMLVVITIIGVLVALLIPTIGAVMRRVRTSAILVELQDLSRAMEAYKSFANDYPPDFTNDLAVINHITKAFPRNTRSVAGWLDPNAPPPPAQFPPPARLDPAEAMVFWLSLLSNNPRDPLSAAGTNYAGERKSFFSFEATRLVDLDGDGWKEYVPPHATEVPYVYFDGRVVGGRYAYATAVYPEQAATPTQPAPVSGMVIRPYRSNTEVNPTRDNGRTVPFDVPPAANNVRFNFTEWMKPAQFQIISAGLDNEVGGDLVVSTQVVFKTYPTPNYTIAGPDEDNLANFSDKGTLGDAVP